MVQNLQAAVRQYLTWQGNPEAAPILIDAALYLAAHSPTPRARHHIGSCEAGAVHEDANEAEF